MQKKSMCTVRKQKKSFYLGGHELLHFYFQKKLFVGGCPPLFLTHFCVQKKDNSRFPTGKSCPRYIIRTCNQNGFLFSKTDSSWFPIFVQLITGDIFLVKNIREMTLDALREWNR